MNNWSGIGRLTRDVELRYTAASQTAVARFTMAIDEGYGEKKKTNFIPVIVFGKMAENVERYLTKGRLVGVQGHIQTGSYTNKDGKTVYTTDVVAERVQFLEWGDRPQQAEEDPIPSGFEDFSDDVPF